MIMIWIWQEEGLKNLFIPKYVPRWFVLPFSSLALQVCSEALHSPWCLHSARACTKLLVLKCGQANNTGHFKNIPHLSLKKTLICPLFLHVGRSYIPVYSKAAHLPWAIPQAFDSRFAPYSEEFDPKWRPPSWPFDFMSKRVSAAGKKTLKFFPHSVCVPCSWAIAVIFAVLLEHLTAFEKAQAFWNEQFYWNEQTSVRQLSKTLDISVVFSRTLTLK